MVENEHDSFDPAADDASCTSLAAEMSGGLALVWSGTDVDKALRLPWTPSGLSLLPSGNPFGLGEGDIISIAFAMLPDTFGGDAIPIERGALARGCSQSDSFRCALFEDSGDTKPGHRIVPLFSSTDLGSGMTLPDETLISNVSSTGCSS